jgi:cell division protein FtsB
MTDREKELIAENENLKKEIIKLKEQIERYRETEVELSTDIDLLRSGVIE